MNHQHEDVIKQLEQTCVPQISLQRHRDGLRRALLQSSVYNQAKPEPNTHSMLNLFKSLLVPISAVAVVAVLAFVVMQQRQDDSDILQNILTPIARASRFAVYEEIPVTVTPSVAPTAVASDMSNITNNVDFQFQGRAKELLMQNGFFVQPATHEEFFSLYEQNRYAYTPNFITTDAILHTYHLLFDDMLKKLEEGGLHEQLTILNAEALTTATQQWEELQGTEWENAAQRTVIFFSVAAKLLNPDAEIPARVTSTVDEELALIEEHAGPVSSPMMLTTGVTDVDEDYSQYISRGHYDKTEQLQRYFKTMMWYGRITFRLSSEDEVRSSILATFALQHAPTQDAWSAIYDTTEFFVGKSDDISYNELAPLIASVYGKSATLGSIVSSEKLDAFMSAAKNLRAPEINSLVIEEGGDEAAREKATKGFRVMGQRFTVDAAIFQSLICRSVGNKHGTRDCGGSIPDSRMLPKSLDIPAALGSNEAFSLLEEAGETEYFHYPEQMQKLREKTAHYDTNTWTQNLYWTWMYTLRPLLDVKSGGYPSFMQNTAWVRKDLNTFLGSWIELKHDTILYAKQAYSELGAGLPDAKDDRGYVEPQPLVYARLTSLLRMTREGLDLRDLSTPVMEDSLSKMETITRTLKTIAEKELNGEALSDAEYEFIRSFGGQLEHFWIETNRDEMASSGLDQTNYLNQNPAAIVADVATNPNGQVLEEGTGYIAEIYVTVPVDGQLRIAKGGVFTTYEFPWPMGDRLTDDAWRELLQSPDAPDAPEWTNAFITTE